MEPGIPHGAGCGATLLALALSMPGPGPPPAGAEGPLPGVRAPVDAGRLALLGRASFHHSEGAGGSPRDAFDGRTGTALRTRGVNPAHLDVTFTDPPEIRTAQGFFPGGVPHEWSLLAGEDPERLRVVFAARPVGPDAWSRVESFRPFRAPVLRIVVRKLAGDDDVLFGEIALEADQGPLALAIEAPSGIVAPEGDLPLRARITYDGGFQATTSMGLRFEGAGAPASDLPFRVLPSGPFQPKAATLRYSRPGKAAVRARIRGRDGDLVSPPFEVEAVAEGLPDWCVEVIERTPRLPFDGPGGGRPPAGSHVTFVARVRNYGTTAAPRVPVRWSVDGEPAAQGWLEPLPRFGAGEASLRLPLPSDGPRRRVGFEVDPDGVHREVTRRNSARSVASDALLLGLWIERPLWEWFHRKREYVGEDVAGFEDWAQVQVARWNALLEGAVHPLTPEGITDRVALDRVVVVEEGALPLSGGLPDRDPDASDRSVDLQWGFPASLLERGDPLRGMGSLLEDLSRARYLVDLRPLTVRHDEVRLRGPEGGALPGSPALPILEEGLLHRSGSGRMMAGDRAGGYGPHEAMALQRVSGLRALGGNRSPPREAGAFLGDLPEDCGIRVVDREGRPLDGVSVRAWRRTPGPDGRAVFGGAPVREGVTGQGGFLSLTEGRRDPFFEGERGGGLDASRGVLLLELTLRGRTCFRFLEVVPFNLARWGGSVHHHHEVVEADFP